MLLLPLLALLTPAHAAEVTAMPAPLRGVATLEYRAQGDAARLVEGETQVGARQERLHTLALKGGFSPYRGIGLVVDLPIAIDQRLVWSQAREMDFDPIQGAGSMVGSAELDPAPVVKGGGLMGPTFSLQVAPFLAEHGGARRVDRTTWLLEAGYRLQDKSNWWKEQVDGGRGAGDGADAVHLRTAFSTLADTSRPYVEVQFDKALTVPTALRAADGSVLTQGAPVRPASTLNLRVGAELPLVEREDLALSLDLRTRFGYRTWQDIPSGLYLADVLSASREVLVTQGEAIHAMGGIGLQVQRAGLLDVLVGGDFGAESPYRVEHPYAIRTDLPTVVWDANLAVRVWIDDPLLGRE